MTWNFRSGAYVAVLISILAAGSLRLRAQGTTGAISGTVTDTSGAVITGEID
jgi:hypothetical protein